MALAQTDCLAGHIGFEPPNPAAGIPQRGFKRDADRIVTIDSDQARGMNPEILT